MKLWIFWLLIFLFFPANFRGNSGETIESKTEQEIGIEINEEMGFNELEKKADLELARLCRIHPDPRVVKDFYSWISSEKISVYYHADSESAIFFSHTDGILYINVAYLLTKNIPDACKFLDLEHQYVHAKWQLEKPEVEVIKKHPEESEDLSEFARVCFELEAEAFFEEAKLAIELHQEQFYPALCEAVKTGDRATFRKALYDLLTKNPAEEDKVLHPYWQKLIE